MFSKDTYAFLWPVDSQSAWGRTELCPLRSACPVSSAVILSGQRSICTGITFRISLPFVCPLKSQENSETRSLILLCPSSNRSPVFFRLRNDGRPTTSIDFSGHVNTSLAFTKLTNSWGGPRSTVGVQEFEQDFITIANAAGNFFFWMPWAKGMIIVRNTLCIEIKVIGWW